MSKEEHSEWIHCNSCSRTTHHALIHRYRNSEWQEDLKDELGRTHTSVDGFKDWLMLECQGCKTVCLRFEEYFSEWTDFNDNGLRTTYYPPRTLGSRSKPAWFDQFIGQEGIQGHFVLIAYRQIYELLESKHNLAALLTCRALLETLSVEYGNGDRKSFAEKLHALHKQELISSNQTTFLNQTIYDAGSAAMHRSYNPSEQIVGYVLDVIEKLLHTIYIEPLIKEHLQQQVPKRLR